MPRYIFSKAEPNELLHIVFCNDDWEQGRMDLCDPGEGLQVGLLSLDGYQSFRPHQHKERPREIQRTQESWVIIRGIIKAHYYDTNGERLESWYLIPGCGTITLKGGHTYESLSDQSQVIEFKTGPYDAQNDKEFIEDDQFV